VTANGKRWSAQISYDSKQHNLGTFDTTQEAALAYDRKARQCGEDRLLNYESIKAAEDAAVQARPPSGFYGVSAKRKRWIAQIYYDSKSHYLGTFDTKQEAALAYDREARQCGGDTPLNYESIAAAEEAAVQAQAEHILVYPKQAKRPASGFYGVSAVKKNRWIALIRYDSEDHHLGTFDTKQEAALAHDREARQRGKYKKLNYESIAAGEVAAAEAQTEHILVHPKQPRPRPPSGFYGVSANKKRWQVKITYDSKDHYLGTFDTKQEAALAYDRKARQCGKDTTMRASQCGMNYESIAAAEEAAVRAQAEYTLEHPKQPKPRPPSGFYGVSASGKWWLAKICYNSKKNSSKKTHNLGTFDTKQEAALAYDRAARQCGEDKPLNYESIAVEEPAVQAGDINHNEEFADEVGAPLEYSRRPLPDENASAAAVAARDSLRSVEKEEAKKEKEEAKKEKKKAKKEKEAARRASQLADTQALRTAGSSPPPLPPTALQVHPCFTLHNTMPLAVEVLMAEKGWNNPQLAQAIGENISAVFGWRKGAATDNVMQRVTPKMRQLLAGADQRDRRIREGLAEV
jgi:hypothetical protein